jgi:MFS family permease
MFVIGLAVFTGASVLCGTATSQPMLIASRFVQGVGGAMAAGHLGASAIAGADHPLRAM